MHLLKFRSSTRYYYFASITVKRDSKEVVISKLALDDKRNGTDNHSTAISKNANPSPLNDINSISDSKIDNRIEVTKEKTENLNSLIKIIQMNGALNPAEYRKYKGLKGDNMSNVELALNTLAEASTTEFSKQQNPQGVNQSAEVARQGGKVAKVARQQLESQLGRSVITSENAVNFKRLQGGNEPEDQ